MRRFSVSLFLAFVVLLGLLALHAPPVAVAQEATPSAAMGPEGTIFAPLGFVQGVMWPSPADVAVLHLHIDAGVNFPLNPNDPTDTVVVVESGTFTVRVEEMAWTISRGAALREMMAAPEEEGDLSSVMEEVAMGEEGTLAAGDVAYVPGSVNGEARNEGQEPAEALLFVVGPPEAMLSATPEP
jgi:hypothetical protein